MKINILGGAGGKGVWGLPGSELLETYEDMDDPNYDVECLTNGDIELKEVIPEIDYDELQVDNIIILFLFIHLRKVKNYNV